MGDDEVGTGRGRGDDAFDGLTLDESFVRGAELSEGSHRDREKDARRRHRQHRRGNRARRTGRWFRRYAPLLLAAAIVVVAVGFGSRGQGPLGQIDAIRALGGLGPAEIASEDPSSPGSTNGSVPTSAGAGDGATTDTTRQLTVEERAPGTCVMWDATMAPSVQANAWSLPCEEPHLFEVVGEYQVDPSAYGPTGPTADEWTALVLADCVPRAEAYLGQPLDLAGRFAVSHVRPSPDGWARGDHAVLCGIGLRDPVDGSTSAMPHTGSVIGQDQSLLTPVGACLANDEALGRREVPCDQPHDAEVVEIVDVSELGPAYPSGEAIVAAMAAECSAAVTRVYGAPPPPEVRFGSLGIPETSWNAGRRSVECFIGAHDGTTWVVVYAPIRAGSPWAVPPPGS